MKGSMHTLPLFLAAAGLAASAAYAQAPVKNVKDLIAMAIDTPPAHVPFIKAEVVKWARVIKAAGITPE